MRLLKIVFLLAAMSALTGACGVEFEPDKFCFRCNSPADCGDGFTCEQDGEAFGWCVPDDPAQRAASPCGPP